MRGRVAAPAPRERGSVAASPRVPGGWLQNMDWVQLVTEMTISYPYTHKMVIRENI